jgi:hypothetical protein
VVVVEEFVPVFVGGFMPVIVRELMIRQCGCRKIHASDCWFIHFRGRIHTSSGFGEIKPVTVGGFMYPRGCWKLHVSGCWRIYVSQWL